MNKWSPRGKLWTEMKQEFSRNIQGLYFQNAMSLAVSLPFDMIFIKSETAKMIHGTKEKKISFQPMYSLMHSAMSSLFIHRL